MVPKFKGPLESSREPTTTLDLQNESQRSFLSADLGQTGPQGGQLSLSVCPALSGIQEEGLNQISPG